MTLCGRVHSTSKAREESIARFLEATHLWGTTLPSSQEGSAMALNAIADERQSSHNEAREEIQVASDNHSSQLAREGCANQNPCGQNSVSLCG